VHSNLRKYPSFARKARLREWSYRITRRGAWLSRRHLPPPDFYPPARVAEHQRTLQQLRSKGEFCNARSTAAEFAEDARGWTADARPTSWPARGQRDHRLRRPWRRSHRVAVLELPRRHLEIERRCTA
jgi:hypothetical protein